MWARTRNMYVSVGWGSRVQGGTQRSACVEIPCHTLALHKPRHHLAISASPTCFRASRLNLFDITNNGTCSSHASPKLFRALVIEPPASSTATWIEEPLPIIHLQTRWGLGVGGVAVLRWGVGVGGSRCYGEVAVAVAVAQGAPTVEGGVERVSTAWPYFKR